MKYILASLALIGIMANAQAQGRPSTTAMTCGQATGVVNQRGAVVLATGRDLYDRYVLSENLCPDFARPAFVPTRDNPQCHIGFYCSNTPPMFQGF